MFTFQHIRNRVGLKLLAIVLTLMVAGAVVIGSVVLILQMRGIRALTLQNSKQIAEVVTESVEASMVRGRADIFHELVRQLRGSRNVKSIDVYNSSGRPAFEKDSPAVAAAELERLKMSKEPLVLESDDEMILFHPMPNSPQCLGCHADGGVLLGAVKVEIDVSEIRNRFSRYLWFAIVGSAAGIAGLSFALMSALRWIVLKPVRQVVKAANRLAEGDLAFDARVATNDELGRMARDLEQAVLKISMVIGRMREVAGRVYRVTEQVRQDSRQLLDGTTLEAEAINSISSSVEEMNTAMARISDNVESLSTSAEETSATVAEMVASTAHVAKRTKELFEAVDATSVSIEEMSATINEVATAANELSVNSDNTLNAVQEIAASIKDVESTARDSTRLSADVAEAASTDGMETTRKVTEGMNRIRESMAQSSEAIHRLRARSEDIGNILSVIDEVTDQTTLLSLNASILAAQAGDQGRGFAVVASQIKSLAGRTAGSTQEIAELIQSIQTDVKETVFHVEDAQIRVKEGIELSSAATQSLERIVEAAGRSAEMVHGIERSTVEQSRNVRVVNGAMSNVRDRVGQIAKATSEQNKGVRLIVDSAERMRLLTSQVEKSTDEQLLSSRQISMAVEQVSEGILQISRSVREQKIGTDQILRSVEGIKHLPARSRDISAGMNQSLREVMKDNELLVTELGRFRSGGLPGERLVLRMGVVPLESPAEMYRRFIPLVDYLSGRLGRQVDLKVSVDFNEAVGDLASGVTHFCFMTPTTYIEAREAHGARVLVRAVRSAATPPHRSAIVTRADSTILSLADLKGRTFAFGDRHSTSSHIVPRAMLHEAGVDVENLRYHDFLGHHDEVADAVLRGDFDAGGVMSAVAEKYRERGLKVLVYSSEIPEFNIAVAASMPEDLVGQLKEALLTLTDTDAAGRSVLTSISESYSKFVESRDDEYEAIREMVKRLGLNTGV